MRKHENLSLKERINEKKRFRKHYFSSFNPITKTEKTHKDRLFNFHNYLFPAISSLTISLLIRKYYHLQYNYLLKNNRLSEVPSKSIFISNLIIVNVLGLLASNILSTVYIWEQTNYIRYRDYYERKNKVSRKEVLLKNNYELYEEYPFHDEFNEMFSDVMVRMRMERKSVVQQTEVKEESVID